MCLSVPLVPWRDDFVHNILHMAGLIVDKTPKKRVTVSDDDQETGRQHDRRIERSGEQENPDECDHRCPE